MSRLFRKVVILLVCLIAVLQVIHITLMSRLEKRKALNERLTKEAQARRRQERRYTAEEVAADRQAMYRSLQSLSSVLDSSGEYRIIAFISTAEELLLKSTSSSSSSKYHHHHTNGIGSQYQHQRPNDVALVTHGTVLQLHHLPLLASRWHGLLSVSVFVVSIQQLPLAVEAILLLRHCSPAIRHRASFHLVYPLNLSAKLSNRQARTVLDFLRWPDILEAYPGLDQLSALEPWSTAENPAGATITSTTTLNYAHKVPYPNNLLRNIGRRYARTEYSFVVDIDLLPSASLYEHFLEFGRRTHLFREWDAALLPEAPADASQRQQRSKVVFVVPTYEIDLSGQWTASGSNAAEKSRQSPSTTTTTTTENKAELIVGIEQRLIRPFYIELCWKCQKWTDYEAWLHASSLINTSEHRVDILFEVFWHDPWEPFYISANSVCELHMAGYRFAVLNNAFLLHKGFKTPGGFHPDKDAELEHNRNLFRQFKLQLKDHYPKSGRRC
ncbi:Beta-1,4-glucuronyltransferase 1 [Tyrophagus putrescentiae]|nr:Beta-1,4-glucuronyltransferase 1 [Tyrophagus putrescentiae]